MYSALKSSSKLFATPLLSQTSQAIWQPSSHARTGLNLAGVRTVAPRPDVGCGRNAEMLSHVATLGGARIARRQRIRTSGVTAGKKLRHRRPPEAVVDKADSGEEKRAAGLRLSSDSQGRGEDNHDDAKRERDLVSVTMQERRAAWHGCGHRKASPTEAAWRNRLGP